MVDDLCGRSRPLQRVGFGPIRPKWRIQAGKRRRRPHHRRFPPSESLAPAPLVRSLAAHPCGDPSDDPFDGRFEGAADVFA